MTELKQLMFDGSGLLTASPGQTVFIKGQDGAKTATSYPMFDYDKRRWVIGISGKKKPIPLSRIELKPTIEYS